MAPVPAKKYRPLERPRRPSPGPNGPVAPIWDPVRGTGRRACARWGFSAKALKARVGGVVTQTLTPANKFNLTLTLPKNLTLEFNPNHISYTMRIHSVRGRGPFLELKGVGSGGAIDT